MSNENPASDQENVSVVSRPPPKIPPFWKAKPQLWFTQIESQFITSNIRSQTTKFHTVVGALEMEILSQVADIVSSPPTVNPYDSLKRRIIETFSDSEEKQIRQLLTDMDLGDKKPSHLLRQMRELGSSSVGDQFLRSLWLQRMPTQVQTILSVSEENDLNKLSLLADKIVEVTQNQIAAIESSSSHPSTNLLPLQTQISELNKKMDELSVVVREGRPIERSSSRCRCSRSRSISRKKEWDKTMCYYHNKFGKKSVKCTKPCSFQEN